MDTEEHSSMQVEVDQLISQVTEEIEISNLARVFIREQIKAECWDGMAVKGLVLKVHTYVQLIFVNTRYYNIIVIAH